MDHDSWLVKIDDLHLSYTMHLDLHEVSDPKTHLGRGIPHSSLQLSSRKQACPVCSDNKGLESLCCNSSDTTNMYVFPVVFSLSFVVINLSCE